MSQSYPGGFTAVREKFDPIIDEFWEANNVDKMWRGIHFNRFEKTRFAADKGKIYLQRDASINRFSVAEEVQHAIDYVYGATDEAVIYKWAKQHGIGDADVNNWWHRRVLPA